ncbi:GNAT family N-acetyltransferase [Tianweitania sediminis]|uniref:N-acetyltransferase n=1 Tax=Tianweitania sediminis TaxID=1502156 RepID=A0A8J7R111_9HYPH|nr:GNAT family N-acetyltransferase [Tianweitania sediminis]MBP0438166.1 N-acetyltransferase [Tianweitania sediminis]
MTDITDFAMREDGQRRRYFLSMPNGEEARLTLVKTSATHWIADHTFVPVPYRGRDIAERLVDRLIADARKEGAKITATCWYVADAFKQHAPDWDDVRA